MAGGVSLLIHKENNRGTYIIEEDGKNSGGGNMENATATTTKT